MNLQTMHYRRVEWLVNNELEGMCEEAGARGSVVSWGTVLQA
jgi:hypothetical protein